MTHEPIRSPEEDPVFDALAQLQSPAGELRLLAAAGRHVIAEVREEVEWLKVVLDAIRTLGPANKAVC